MSRDSTKRQRKYSVGEIDRMRRATWAILNAQWGKGPWHEDCETRLRTYMLNGTSPQELEREAHQAQAKRAADAVAVPALGPFPPITAAELEAELTEALARFREPQRESVFDSYLWTGRR